MKQDLDSLKRDIERQLQDGGYVVFHAHSRFSEKGDFIYWHVDQHPNPSEFLETALSLGVKLITYHSREFEAEVLEEAKEKLEEADLPREFQREMERRVARMEAFVGFTNAIEVSFDFDGRTYIYDVTAPWFDEYLDLLEEIDEAIEYGDEEEPPPMGGYFSQN